jgi:hypothetical protein
MFKFFKKRNEDYLRLKVFKLAKLADDHDDEVIYDTNEFKLFRVFFEEKFRSRPDLNQHQDNLKEVVEEFAANKKNKNMLSDLYRSLASYELVLKTIPFRISKKYAIHNGANHSNYENDPEDDVLLFWIKAPDLANFPSEYDKNHPFIVEEKRVHKGNPFANSFPYGISIMRGSNYGEKGTIIQCESKLRMIIGMNG